MIRKMVILLCAAALMARVPMAAGANDAAEACTADDEAQLIALLTTLNEDVFGLDEIAISDDPNPESIAEYVIRLEAIIETYNADIRPELPTCADAFFLGETLGLLYENTLQALILDGFGIYLNEYDHHRLIALEVFWAAIQRSDYSQKFPAPDELVLRLEQSRLFADGFPTCGIDIAAQLAEYDSYFQDYVAMLPEYDAFLESGSGDILTLLEFEQLSMDAFSIESDVCYESFSDEIRYNELFLKTSMVIHALELAALEEQYGSSETAAAYRAIADKRRESVNMLLPLFLPPE